MSFEKWPYFIFFGDRFLSLNSGSMSNIFTYSAKQMYSYSAILPIISKSFSLFEVTSHLKGRTAGNGKLKCT